MVSISIYMYIYKIIAVNRTSVFGVNYVSTNIILSVSFRPGTNF